MEDTLWTDTHCRRSDPPTSRAAAASLASSAVALACLSVACFLLAWQ